MICGTCGSPVTDPDTPYKDGVGIYCSGPCLPDQGEMIYHMPYLEDMASRASVIIEIGCGHGNGSTRALERGLKRTTHPDGAKLFVSVDMEPHYPEVVPTLECWRKITSDSRAQAGVDGVNMLRIAAGVYDKPVDLVYIDTTHDHEHMWAELNSWKSIMGPATVVLAHDSHMFGFPNDDMVSAMTQFCDNNPGWVYEEITKESHGMAMLRFRQ